MSKLTPVKKSPKLAFWTLGENHPTRPPRPMFRPFGQLDRFFKTIGRLMGLSSLGYFGALLSSSPELALSLFGANHPYNLDFKGSGHQFFCKCPKHTFFGALHRA